MLIQNKSSTVVAVMLCLGKVASPFQHGGISTKRERERDGDGTTVACKGLLRRYAFVGIATRPAGFCSRVGGGTVGYIQTKQGTEGTRARGRKRGQRIRCEA